jgi:hypothetical protein
MFSSSAVVSRATRSEGIRDVGVGQLQHPSVIVIRQKCPHLDNNTT